MTKVLGKHLAKNLRNYPEGTEFLCIGHLDDIGLYKEGEVYIIVNKSLHKKGVGPTGKNGFSGLWEQLNTDVDTSLKDFL